MIRSILVAGASLALAGTAAAQEARLHYAGGMTIVPEHAAMSLDWRITVLEDDLDEISLFLNDNFPEAEIGGADVVSVASERVEGFAGMMRTYTVTLAPSPDGTDRVIEMRYGGVLLPEPMDSRINTVDPDKVELTVDSFWMPFDQRFSSLVTAELDIALDGEWSGVGIQQMERRPGGFRLVQDRPGLDVAFTLMSDFERVETPDYVIYDTRPETREGLPALTDALEFCTGFLDRLAGEAGPLPQAAVTVTERSSGGYSRATLIALTDISETEPDDLAQFICHELGHYWSRGNPMTIENWLNESFADYVAIMGMREAHGEDAFEARLGRYRARLAGHDGDLPAIWAPGMTARPPYLVAYRKGPLALARLEAHLGRRVFADFMRRCMIDEVATTPQMLGVLESVAGSAARTWFEAVLAE